MTNAQIAEIAALKEQLAAAHARELEYSKTEMRLTAELMWSNNRAEYWKKSCKATCEFFTMFENALSDAAGGIYDKFGDRVPTKEEQDEENSKLFAKYGEEIFDMCNLTLYYLYDNIYDGAPSDEYREGDENGEWWKTLAFEKEARPGGVLPGFSNRLDFGF